MDGISSASSVIAVIQLTGSIVKICGGYIHEVKDARDDIITLQRTLAGLEGVLEELSGLLQGPAGMKLSASTSLFNNISECRSHLETLEQKIDLGRGKRMMKRLGLRALKWPLKRTEVDRIINDLERYKSSFILSLQVDQTVLLTGVAQSADQMDQYLILDKLPIARGAEFDSYMDQHEDECLPGTRTELLQRITEWARSPQEKCIFWLNGKAGTGKSTICRTVAKSFNEASLLGASYFFKRGEGDRGNATKFFPTIAQQLMIRIPKLKPVGLKAIKDEPDLAGKSLKEQFDRILLQPLLSLESAKGQVITMVIVIDALDECDNDKDVRVILQLLPQLRVLTAVRVLIFLTSRDEMPIKLGFLGAGDNHEAFALHEIPEAVTAHDISLFLKDRFAKISETRDVSKDWPGDEKIQTLVMMSVPLFISAATVCRFLEDLKWDPEQRLAELLKDQAKYATKMEKTYLPVLKRLLETQDIDESEQLLQQFQDIVGITILLAVPLSVNALSQLLRTRRGVISNLLSSFQSVLNIPENQNIPVRLLHSSFRDFLVNSRSKFRVDEQRTHKVITQHCLTIMRDGLKRNICGLPSCNTQRREIDAQSIQSHIPEELQYACRYWVHHLSQCENPCSASEMHDTLAFLQNHFLHWIEAICILGLASEVVGIINLLESVLNRDENHKLSEFLHDAKRFFLKNRQIADDVPGQIYYAGLVFAPKQAIVRKQFEAELPDCICKLPEGQETWSAELQTLEGHAGYVFSVTFSPLGRFLASGSSDKAVRIWDANTGTLQQTLEAHSGTVYSVAFSPDGRMLASGASDRTIRLWNTDTGTLEKTLDGDSDWAFSGPISSVTFSPDGRLLASALSEVVMLWNPSTGVLERTLKGHTRYVSSVAFSPDGRMLVSAADETVALWDAITGARLHRLRGDSGFVSSVAFSPSGELLATASKKTVSLWDPTTGALQQTIGPYSGSIFSVAFSPDSRFLAFGSGPKVRLWDTSTDALQQTFDGHASTVLSVAFSPDGRTLASSSYAEAVRLWDTGTGSVQQTPKRHAGWVQSVAFSPDGKMLASGSLDKTVGLWCTETGTLQQILKGYSGSVSSMTFSPDGRLLASGSDDDTIRVWDTSTGVLLQTSTDKTTKEHEVDLESVEIESWYNNHPSGSSQADSDISILEGQWVTFHGEKVLWLPAEYRPLCSATKYNILAMGHSSGRVSFIGFCV